MTPEEFSVLLQGIDQSLLVGCPEVNHCFLTPIETSQKAEPLLKEKELLNEQGNLTKKGAYTLQWLEKYTANNCYLFVNNCFMSFDGEVGLGLLHEEGIGYQLTQMTKQELLEEVYLTNELVRGETGSKDIRRKEISLEKERQELLTNLSTPLLSVGTIQTNEQKITSIDETIFYKKNDQLVEINVPLKRVYETSQELMNKKIVDVIGIPYEQVGGGWFD